MRVLLSAYACVPYTGSEPGVGWEMVLMAARQHTVTVLTTAANAEPLRAALEKEDVAGVRVVPIATAPWLAKHAYGFGLGHVDYLSWQRRARRVIDELSDEHDVVHHVTYTSDWQPSAALAQDKLPVVWGPVGSLAPFPWFLMRYLFIRSVGAQVVRQVATRAFRRGRLRETTRPGTVVVAVSQDTARYFHRAPQVKLESTCALDPVPPVVEDAQSARSDGTKRALFVGRLVAFKGAGIALAVLKELPEEWHLDIYGAGVEEAHIVARAERLGIAHRVHLNGLRPRSEVEAALRSADCLLFPSLSDGSSYTVAEAVRVGCPVVCLDIGGPPVLVQGTNGVAVKPDRHAVANLAAAVQSVQRGEPDDRFNRDRLPDVLTEWYEAAVEDFHP